MNGKLPSPVTVAEWWKNRRGESIAAQDSAITCSIALQFGAYLETIRKALCRDSQGKASSPLGVALDVPAGSARP